MPENEAPTPKVHDRLFKMLLGSAAGFLATAFVENAYDKMVVQRRARNEQ